MQFVWVHFNDLSHIVTNREKAKSRSSQISLFSGTYQCAGISSPRRSFFVSQQQNLIGLL